MKVGAVAKLASRAVLQVGCLFFVPSDIGLVNEKFGNRAN
jgi:hypothetical protein